MAVKNPECPICEETFQDGRGLSGHLQFKHDLSEEERKEKLNEGMSRGEKRASPAPSEVGGKTGRSIRDRELELKGRLREIEQEIEDANPWNLTWWKDDGNRVEELKQRKQEIEQEIERINAE